jgi:hypothetical protein
MGVEQASSRLPRKNDSASDFSEHRHIRGFSFFVNSSKNASYRLSQKESKLLVTLDGSPLVIGPRRPRKAHLRTSLESRHQYHRCCDDRRVGPLDAFSRGNQHQPSGSSPLLASGPPASTAWGEVLSATDPHVFEHRLGIVQYHTWQLATLGKGTPHSLGVVPEEETLVLLMVRYLAGREWIQKHAQERREARRYPGAVRNSRRGRCRRR